MKLHQVITFALAGLLLAGCAATHARYQREQARLDAIHAAAGKPVGAFNFVARSIWSWEPLSEQELLVYTRPNQAWLLNVGLCPELPYTTSIALTSHVGQVSTMRDSVLVHRGDLPCNIQKIQPVDVAALRKPMPERAGGTVQPEPASSTAKR